MDANAGSEKKEEGRRQKEEVRSWTDLRFLRVFAANEVWADC
jgi:hypothetical protein